MKVDKELSVQIVRNEGHLEIVKDLLKEEGVECSLKLRNQHVRKMNSQKRAGAVWR